MTAVARASPQRPLAIFGCWEVGGRLTEGAKLTLMRKADGGIAARSEFPRRPKGGPRVFTTDAIRVPGSTELQVLCRPRSQHGSFCRVSAVTDGLLVRVFALGHGNATTGRRIEAFVAKRCR